MNGPERCCVFFSGVAFILLSSGRVEAQWTFLSDRLQLTPQIQFVVEQSDNIFHAPDTTQNDLMTAIRPKILSEAALTDNLYCSLEYMGDFRHYWDFDNLDSIRQKGELEGKWTQPRGGEFKVGTRLYDSTIQAFSEEGENRDYSQWEVYFDSLFKVGSWTETGLNFELSSRDFDDDQWLADDYDRYGFTWHAAYKRLPFTTFIGEYSFSHQENDYFSDGPLEIDVHSVLFGPEWRSGRRLSGKLLGGYSWISGNTVSDSSSFSFLVNLRYSYSKFTSITLDAFHSYSTSTGANRETNVYKEATGGTLTAYYTRWKPFHIITSIGYENREFKGEDVLASDRADDYYKANFGVQYPLKTWLRIEAKYTYRKQDSDLQSVEYEENLGTMTLSFSF